MEAAIAGRRPPGGSAGFDYAQVRYPNRNRQAGQKRGTVIGNMVKQIFINAPPNVVYKFLTDARKIARWMGTLSGSNALRERRRQSDIDRRIALQRGTVKRLANSAVLFRLELNVIGKTVESVIEIHLEKRGSGTWVRLTHRELPKTVQKISGKRANQPGRKAHGTNSRR